MFGRFEKPNDGIGADIEPESGKVEIAKLIVYLVEGNRVQQEPNPQLEENINEFRERIGDKKMSREDLIGKAFTIARSTEI